MNRIYQILLVISIISLLVLFHINSHTSMKANNSKVIFQKEIRDSLTFYFTYEADTVNKKYLWSSSIQNNKKKQGLLLDTFSYSLTNLPVRLTPDVWEESFNDLFSILDVIFIQPDQVWVLYDKFGDVHFTSYCIDTLNQRIEKDNYPVQKYSMSFLMGYHAGYGKIIKVNNVLYAYYTAAVPPRSDLITMSLGSKIIKKLNFIQKTVSVKEDDPVIIKLIAQKQEQNEKILLRISDLLETVHNKKSNIILYSIIRDVEAFDNDNIKGVIYYLVRNNAKMMIIRYSITENSWIVDDYIEEEVKIETGLKQ